MAKLASMRESLNREEKELYEKYRKGRSDVTSENPVKEIGGSQNADNSNVVFENESRPGVNYINVLRAAFTRAGPISVNTDHKCEFLCFRDLLA